MRTAFAFLTRLPVGGRPLTVESMSRAVPWFPVVGLAVGGAMAGTRALAGLALDPVPATVLAVLAGILVTGGLHEDGLADSADAVGAHATSERRREILHDPRVGTYGALALVFVVTFSVVALAPLDTADFARAAVAGHVLGRAAIVLVVTAPIARFGSAALLRPSLGAAAASVVGAASAVALATGADGVVAVGAALITGAVAVVALCRSLGGLNGDALGALTAVTVLATYGTLGAAWS